MEYELIDPIHDMREGLEDSEEPIHDRGLPHRRVKRPKEGFQEFGDIEGMKENSVASHKKNWIFAGVNHAFTEPHAVVAHWDQLEGLRSILRSRFHTTFIGR